MSENVQEKKSSSKTVIILLIVIIVLIIGGAVTAIAVLLNRNNEEIPSAEGEEATTVFTLGYENNGVVIIDQDEFNQRLEEAAAKIEDGMINVQYKHVIQSSDGVNFDCYIGNAATNSYDVYYGIYLDNDYEKQMLLTQLIPPGSLMEHFESEIPVEPGTHEALLVYTQVEDDHATIHGMVQLVLTVIVGDAAGENTVAE